MVTLISHLIPAAIVGNAGVSGILTRKSKKERVAVLKDLDKILRNILRTEWMQDPKASPLPTTTVTVDSLKDKLAEEPILSRLDHETLLVMSIYKNVIRARLERTRRAVEVDNANLSSTLTLGVSGIAELTAGELSHAHVAAGMVQGASALSIVSTLFYLGASIKGWLACSKALEDNKQQQDILRNIYGQYDFASRLEDPSRRLSESLVGDLEGDGVAVQMYKLEEEAEYLKINRNYHIINIIAAVLSLAAAIIAILGTQGIILLPVLVYWACLGAGAVLPIAAMAYRYMASKQLSYKDQVHEAQGKLPPPTSITVDFKQAGTISAQLNAIATALVSDEEERSKIQGLIQEVIKKAQGSDAEQEQLVHIIDVINTILSTMLIEEEANVETLEK